MDILIFIIIIIGSAIFSANKKTKTGNKTTSSKKINTKVNTNNRKNNNNQKNYNYKNKKSKTKKQVLEPVIESTFDIDSNRNTNNENIFQEIDDNRIETEYINEIGEEIRKNPKKAFIMSEIFNRKY